MVQSNTEVPFALWLRILKFVRLVILEQVADSHAWSVGLSDPRLRDFRNSAESTIVSNHMVLIPGVAISTFS